MQELVYNPQKGRLENITVDYNSKNTTRFWDHPDIEKVHTITDVEHGILIKGQSYGYPVYVYNVSRAEINNDVQKVLQIMDNALRIHG